MQDNKQLLPFQFFIFSVRNYLWAIAAALCILGGAGSYSATVMVKAPIQKFFLFALGSTSCVASLAVLHQFIKAESMFNTSEESAQMGWRELNVKAFAPIDQRGFDDGSGDEVEAEDPDLNFWEEINSYDPPIRAIALVLASFNIRTSLREDIDPTEEMDDRVRLHFKFPQSSEPGKTVTIKRVQGLTTEIASKASIDMPLEISAEPGGMAIDLLKEVEYAEPETPRTEIPKAEFVAVEDKDSEEARKAASNRLPDGAILVEATALNKIDRYPVLMVIAGQGSGKTATLNWILTQLLGYKVIASPKPLSGVSQGVADLIFGFNKETKQWLNFGKFDETDFSEDKDLSSYIAKEEKIAGSMLDFVWACKRESMNRQMNQVQNLKPWRCVFDESAYTYLSGYDDPLAHNSSKLMKKAQELIASCNRDAYMNYRSQLVQTFFGSQVATVDAIGLKGFAAARDEAWWLYPGLAAINEADRLERFQLKQWLQRRVKAGFGVAIMVKQDSIIEVINMPTLEVLEKFSHD